MKTFVWAKLRKNLERSRVSSVPTAREGLNLAYALLDELQDVVGRHVTNAETKRQEPTAYELGDAIFRMAEELKREIGGKWAQARLIREAAGARYK